jgi:PKHD-type hydroxylase
VLTAIPNILTNEEVTQARKLLDAADWVDGRVTAGPQAAKVKDNAQVPQDHPIARQLGEMILAALSRNPSFTVAAHPLRVLPPMFSRYSGGQQYGTHVDNAIRQVPGSGHLLRADLSATLFLSAPEEYDGGELCIEDAFGFRGIKLPPGHLVLYPATSKHRVAPVTRGTRFVSFFWIQSMIRDEARRALLYDLNMSTQLLKRDHPEHPSIVTLTAVINNLLRQWAEM